MHRATQWIFHAHRTTEGQAVSGSHLIAWISRNMKPLNCSPTSSYPTSAWNPLHTGNSPPPKAALPSWNTLTVSTGQRQLTSFHSWSEFHPLEVQRSSLANTLTCRHSIWETGRLKANGTHYSVGSMHDTNWGPEVGGGGGKSRRGKGRVTKRKGDFWASSRSQLSTNEKLRQGEQ